MVVTCPGSSCSYPNQYIPQASAKPLTSKCRWGATFQDGTVAQNLTGCIHFVPDATKTVTLKNVSINAPYVYLDGFTLAGTRGTDGEIVIQNQPGGGPCLVPNIYTDIIVRNVNAYNFFIKGAAYLSFVNDVFDSQFSLANTVHECAQSPHPYDTNHILFDRVTVKNVYWDGAGQHVEGIHWWNGDQVLITNSKFLNDAQFDINFDGDRGNLTHITVQNSIFDRTCSHQTFVGGCQAAQNNGLQALAMNNRDLRYQTSNNIFAYNSFPLTDWPIFSSAGNMSNIRVFGSITEGPQDQYQCNLMTSIGVRLRPQRLQHEPALSRQLRRRHELDRRQPRRASTPIPRTTTSRSSPALRRSISSARASGSRHWTSSGPLAHRTPSLTQAPTSDSPPGLMAPSDRLY